MHEPATAPRKVAPKPLGVEPVRASWRIMVRLASPIAGVSLLLLTMGIGASWYVHRLQRTTSDLLTRNIADIRASEELALLLSQVRSELERYVQSGELAHLESAAALRPETARWLGEVERFATIAEERTVLARLREAQEHFWAELDRIEPSDGPEPVARLLDDVLQGTVVPLAQSHLDLSEILIARSGARNQALTERVALGLLLLGACGCVAGLLAGFGIARGVSRSLVQLSVPIHDAAGRLSTIVGPVTLSTSWDVDGLETALRGMADHIGTIIERLEQSRREAQHAEQLAALGQLAAGLAHELRNPLTAMKILVQAAAEGGETAALRGRRLNVLEEEITRLEAQIQAFLDFARPPHPEKSTCVLNDIIERTLLLARPQADLQRVTTEYRRPDSPVTLRADPGQLRQLLLNLLLNAIDATPEGGQVQVELTRGADAPPTPQAGTPPARDPRGQHQPPRPGDGWVTIRVADSGPGLPESLGERIFEPFVSTRETGLGLGLPVCRRIVEAHGGRLRATRRPEGGTLFTIELPGDESDPPPNR